MINPVLTEKEKAKMQAYYIIETLAGNFVLKETVKDTENLEYEIYASNKDDAKAQFKAHIKQLKKEGLA